MNDNSFLTPQRMMKIGTALGFDLVKFVFSILFIFAPLIACVAGAAVVANNGGGSTAQKIGCAVGAVATGAFEWITGGLGATAVQAVGEVLADAVDFMAWVAFSIWFMISGTKFSGGKRGTSRFFAGAGSAVLGAIPFLNIAPTITLGVVTVEWQQWKEDKEKAANDNAARSRDEQLAEQRHMLQQAQLIRQQQEESYRVQLERQTLQAAAQDANDNGETLRAAA